MKYPPGRLFLSLIPLSNSVMRANCEEHLANSNTGSWGLTSLKGNKQCCYVAYQPFSNERLPTTHWWLDVMKRRYWSVAYEDGWPTLSMSLGLLVYYELINIPDENGHGQNFCQRIWTSRKDPLAICTKRCGEWDSLRLMMSIMKGHSLVPKVTVCMMPELKLLQRTMQYPSKRGRGVVAAQCLDTLMCTKMTSQLRRSANICNH